jgi:hypothetical protein
MSGAWGRMSGPWRLLRFLPLVLFVRELVDLSVFRSVSERVF